MRYAGTPRNSPPLQHAYIQRRATKALEGSLESFRLQPRAGSPSRHAVRSGFESYGRECFAIRKTEESGPTEWFWNSSKRRNRTSAQRWRDALDTQRQGSVVPPRTREAEPAKGSVFIRIIKWQIPSPMITGWQNVALLPLITFLTSCR